MSSAPLLDRLLTTAASSATAAQSANYKESWWTNRVPEHEPWARVMTKISSTDQDSGNTHAGAAEYTYEDPLIGKTERGTDLGRNSNWRR